MFDLIVKGGTLPDGQVVDIGIKGSKIAALADLSDAQAGQIIDASGDLVSPPFVDPHFHMDATLSYGLPRINTSGTLLEGIGLWGELKQIMTQDEVVNRALKYCDWAASMGVLAIRSHVDTCDDRLLGVEALIEVRDRVKDYIDLQLVAFPQDGFIVTRQHVKIRSALWIWALMLWAASPTSSAQWRMVRPQCASFAKLPPRVDCRSICIATKATTPIHATSKPLRMKHSALVCRAV